MKRSHVTWTTLLVIVSLLIGPLGWLRPVTPSIQAASPESAGAPVVVQRTPERGEEMALDQPIVIVFDRAMDHGRVEGAFSISPGVPGTFEWPDDRSLHFRPNEPFARDSSFTVQISQEAVAGDGTPLAEPYTFRFRTVGYLEVTQVIPTPDSADLEVDSTFTVMFNRPVVPLTNLAQQAELPQPLTLEPPANGKGQWLNTSVYTFKPDKSLAGGTKYTVRVKAGLTDTTGGLLAQDFTWSFTTQPPQIVFVSPAADATLVTPDSGIQVTFSQAIDCNSAEKAFSVSKRGFLGLAAEVPGKVTCSGADFVFKPTERLAFNAGYQAEMKLGVIGEAGGTGMVETKTWRFTVVPLPKIIDTSPRNGDRSAPSYTGFTIKFNAPINPDTVMPNVQFTPPITPSAVYTYYNEWDRSFTIDFGAKPSSDYKVVIGPNIEDPYGNTTGQKRTVSFRTRALDPRLYLLAPGRVSTHNVNDPARLFVQYLNVSRLEFRLYRLDFKGMTDAFDQWYDYEPPRNELVRKWSLQVEAPLNEIQSVPVQLVEQDAKLKAGIYMLIASSPTIKEDRWSLRHILVASSVNLTLKSSDDQVLVWATDADSGRPVEGLDLQVMDRDGSLMKEGQTQSDGLASFAVQNPRNTELYVSSRDPFTLASEQWNEGISVGEFGFDRDYGTLGLRAHVYTDRPIYRAGQTVYFRGIIRRDQDAAYSLPVHRDAQVRITDARGEEVLNKPVQLDSLGAFGGELSLAAGAALGYYQLNVLYQDTSFSASFQVAAYRPPEFEVQVKPQAAEIVAGEPTSVTVNVSYFFGGAVANVPVQWNVLARPYHHSSAQFGRYSFSDTADPWLCFECWWRPPVPATPILNGSGVTDEKGQLVIELPGNIVQLGSDPDQPNPTGSRSLTVDATVQGTDGSVISGRNTVVVHQGAFYIGLAPQQVVGHANKEMSVDILTVDWSDNRFPNQPLTVEVHRHDWVNTFVEDKTGGGTWKWETKDELVYTTQVTTDANAEAKATFTPKQGGSYRVIVNGRDETERLVQSSIFLWVSSPESVSWRRENNDRIDLIPDKSTYNVGDTAEILIPSPFEGEQWALLTVERGTVLSQEVIKLTSNSYVYKLPITSQHIPNLYVSAVIIKGKDATNKVTTYKVGYTALSVNLAPVKLNIAATPSAKKAGPGDTVNFDLKVTDVAGEPVQGAFSLDLVDKAVLSLSPREPDAIVDAFYGHRGLRVETASGLAISLERLLQEQTEQFRREAEGKGRKDTLGMSADMAAGEVALLPPGAPMATAAPAPAMAKAAAPPPGVALRQEFADTAYWNPSVVTDPQGQATVSVKLPDNLTTWVFRGVGVTGATQVGEAVTDLLVTKPLLIRPVTPRFMVVDDEMQLAAIVNNNTDAARDVEVALSSTGLNVMDPPQQTLKVNAGAEAKVIWNVKVTDVETVDVVFSAVSGEYNDAAKPRLTTGPEGTLLVHRYSAPDIVGTAGQLTSEGTRTEVVALPPKYDDRQGELDVRLDPSLAAGMQDGLKYLEHFPYECSEQTVSRFLPNVLTYQALKKLGLSNPELEAKLPPLVKEGLNKLYLQQNENGGWGWWASSESRPHLTAYIIFAMSKALEAGFGVKDEVYNRGLQYLRGQLTTAEDIGSYREANLQAFILYVLTDSRGNADKFGPQIDSLYRNREKLSHYGKAFLALSIGRLNNEDPRLGTLLSDLQNAAILSATGAHWEETDYDWWAMNTDTRSTAVILDALATLDPSNELVQNVVRWLMVARKEGIWETTQETAWALIALTDWMVQTGELQGEYDYAVNLNGRELKAGGVDSSNIRESITLRVQVKELLKGQGNRLTISRGGGPGRLYYTAHLKVYLPVEEIQPVNRGISVFREYNEPTCRFSENCPELKEAQVGDTVQVRLTIVAPHDLYYVMVEDPLPAGAEAIDVNLATTSVMDENPTLRRQAKEGKKYEDYWWWRRWYSHTEMRDDKVVLFADYLPAGTYQYVYTFRAYLPGQYRVIPTVADEMYFPEVFGRSDGRLFTIR